MDALSQFPQTHRTLAAWLALFHCRGIGPTRFNRLLDQFGAPERILGLPATTLTAANLPAKVASGLAKPAWERVHHDLRWLAANEQHHILTLADDRYPPLLKQITDPPPVLFIHGDPRHLPSPQLAIVGSRNPSPGGLENAKRFARTLSGAGLCITSGMALGIDAAAHQGALAVCGPTIAVIGCGPDIVYPARHRQLATAIAGQGAIVSEFAPGTRPLAENFPRRNRIISGMALGVLVVEAAPQSGSLITARLAGEQSREVFAIPGSIHNPLVRGCHALIRQGAKLVETIEDILEELPAIAAPLSPALGGGEAVEVKLDDKSLLLISKLGYDPVSVDILVARTQLTPEEVSSILLLLELSGTVKTAPGGLYTKADTIDE